MYPFKYLKSKSMKKQWYTQIMILILMLSSGMASAQKLIMEETVDPAPGNSLLGQNKRHFIETRLFYGLMVNQENHSYPVKLVGSGEFEAIVRYKLKINPILSTGLSASYLNQQFVTKKNNNLPDSLSPTRALFKINSIKPAAFIRFNIDPKRGNYLGKYIETGLYGVVSYSLKHVLVNKYEVMEEKGYRKSKEILSGLNYLSRFQYGTYISIGFGNFEISYRYRISRIPNGLAYPTDPRIDYELWDFPKNALGLSVRLGI